VLFLSLLVSSCGAPLTLKDELLPDGGKRCPQGSVDPSYLESLTSDLHAASGVKVSYATTACSRTSVRCQPVNPDQGRTIELLLGVIAGEFARYPDGFLASNGPDQVWLVNDLRSETLGREASGIAFYAGRVVYLAVPGDCGESAFRRTIQHELFHIFDPRIVRDQKWEDAWAANNPPGFRYSGHSAYDGSSGRVDQPRGFASWYARTTSFEDRAESFAHGLVDPYAGTTKKRSVLDRYLAAKQETMESWLKLTWPELTDLLADF
jgi:hypothetical protein